MKLDRGHSQYAVADEQFDVFQVGQVLSFERTFYEEEHASFFNLSQDANPLHLASEFSKKSEFGRPVVPMHMLIAPFSRIAGMNFPGLYSMYLGHETRAISPVFFGETLVYSARIMRVNRVHRVLEVKVLVIRDVQVVLEGTMRTQNTKADEVQLEISHEARSRTQARPTAAVTGALGNLGRALALDLVRRNFDLILIYRGSKKRAEDFRAELLHQANTQGQEAAVSLLKLDLARPITSQLEDSVALNPPTHLIHAASPPPSSSLDSLVSVNFQSLRDLVGKWMNTWLRGQDGTVINVSSTATVNPVPGWESYAAAKAMSENFVSSIQSRYGLYGVTGINVILGRLMSDFADQFRESKDEVTLLPEEAARILLKRVLDDGATGAIRIASGVRVDYQHFETPAVEEEDLTRPAGRAEEALLIASDSTSEEILKILAKKFHLKHPAEAIELSLGSIPAWDSLSHIELVLLLEKHFDISFTSQEIVKLTSAKEIIETVSSLRGY